MDERQRVDASAVSLLALCSCGWRSLSSSRVTAREAIVEHVRNCHPEQLHRAQSTLHTLRKRHA